MNLVPVAFSMPTVRIWSSCLEPVPPILILLGPAAFTAPGSPWRSWRGLGVDPQHEVVERHHGHRRHVAPVEGNAGRHRRGEQVGQRDDDLVRIALGALDVEEALGAGAAGLVDDDQRLLHQLVLDDDALHQARHLVGAATGAGGYWSRTRCCTGLVDGSQAACCSNALDGGQDCAAGIKGLLHAEHGVSFGSGGPVPHEAIGARTMDNFQSKYLMVFITCKL
jgi:hypothetical protein